MDVKQTLQAHIDGLFADAPKSRAAYELREELLANSLERYEDLTRGGMEENAAIQLVMQNIGDVDELLAALPKDMGSLSDEDLKKSAWIKTVAVGLYILAGVVFIIGMFLSSILWDEAMFIFLAAAGLICIVPTCMLVYNAQIRPQYQKNANTVVEDFKEWNQDTKRTKATRGAISSIIWTVCLVVYFVVSFATFAWYITWVIFLVAACAEAVVSLLFAMRKLK